MRQFKVGDKLIVKDNLRYINDFVGGYVDSMDTLIGKVVTVSEVCNTDSVKIEEDENNYRWDNRAFELVRNIIKNVNDLQNGDIVTLRNGDRLMLVGDDFRDLDDENDNSLADMDDLNSDLSYNGYSNRNDIVKVERAFEYQTVYNRENTVKEMTVEEISKALGYEVKIVKEAKDND